MYYVDHTKPPFIDISLPPAITLPVTLLVSLYAGVLGLDFYLLRHERLFRKVISPTQLRIAMAIVHAVIPLVFVCNRPPFNVFFAGAPWLLATYTAAIPTENLTMEKWVRTLMQVTIVQRPEGVDDRKIRYKGIAKISLAIFKLVFMHLFVDSLLPRHIEYVLEYSWIHPVGIFYTFLFGLKAYCLLGVIDLLMGVEQTLFAWNMIDLFNSPIIASSPRDFWSRRWNKVVRNLLHSQIFKSTKEPGPENKPAQKMKETSNNRRVTRSLAAASKAVAETKNVIHDVTVTHVHPKRSSSFWTTASGRGLLAFIVSGTFHEVIIMSVCRKITLENFVFFMLQGLAVMMEVKLRQGAWKQEPIGMTRVWCIGAQLLFMSITGRLFIAPFLRCQSFLESARFF
ncbi:hypothetical protein INT48_004872 [Thamnidium elegans]|uniref:Wax synthase domain-containing protein n=1 Tax=Thamnidium elegans TaxID=101142 RepID=A0A8H7SUQ4_9FUNG|nr:hypothetical protein INT48_004872 [Thamnidium elegans]